MLNVDLILLEVFLHKEFGEIDKGVKFLFVPPNTHVWRFAIYDSGIETIVLKRFETGISSIAVGYSKKANCLFISEIIDELQPEGE